MFSNETWITGGYIDYRYEQFLVILQQIRIEAVWGVLSVSHGYKALVSMLWLTKRLG